VSVVVSDSSPINFLVRLGAENVLPQLFARVFVPVEVVEELTDASAPEVVRSFAASPPAWLEVRSPRSIPEIPRLHRGEIAAIALAIELGSTLILMDDRAARDEAARRGLRPVGLLGVLDRAARAGLIPLRETLEALPADYRIDPALVRRLLEGG
jgi:predicted nucleic acid-binding protein